jgi:hypothetical protein
MTALTKQARETIKNYWIDLGDKGIRHLTIAGYVRYQGYDSVAAWGGDVCGCPDDRCANGFHHSGVDDCGCLPVLLDQYADGLRRGFTSFLDELGAR